MILCFKKMMLFILFNGTRSYYTNIMLTRCKLYHYYLLTRLKCKIHNFLTI